MSASPAPSRLGSERRGPAALPAVTPTPLVEIEHPELEARTRLFAKLESVHPSGSIKERPVSRIIGGALVAGHLGGGRRLLDSSSGNAGIAYAMIGARLGVPVTLVVPGNASRERLERIRAHGAELVLTDPLEGYDYAIREARRLAGERPDLYWYADQYGNEDNWRAHYETTGAELLDQARAATGEAPGAFVAGIGTGGTFTGVGRRLRAAAPHVHLATVAPDLFPGVEGLKPLGGPDDLVPAILDESLVDRRIEVTTEEAVEACRWLARRGLFVGPSSGANLVAALEVARSGSWRVLVTVFSDTGERYISTGMWGP
jgi:cysteine synthase B